MPAKPDAPRQCRDGCYVRHKGTFVELRDRFGVLVFSGPAHWTETDVWQALRIMNLGRERGFEEGGSAKQEEIKRCLGIGISDGRELGEAGR
jgi:hypothetical protein